MYKHTPSKKVCVSTIPQQANAKDCQIEISRIERIQQQDNATVKQLSNRKEEINATIKQLSEQRQEIEKKIQQLNQEAVAIVKILEKKLDKIDQNTANQTDLNEQLAKFQQQDQKCQYLDRCIKFIIDFINQHPENLENVCLRYYDIDVPDNIKLGDIDLTQLKSTEIINLAHYLHGCVIIENKAYEFENDQNYDPEDHQEIRRRELYSSANYDDLFQQNNGGMHEVTDTNIYFDPTVDCCGHIEGDDDYRQCCDPKMYAWRLISFDDITLDTDELLEWTQIYH